MNPHLPLYVFFPSHGYTRTYTHVYTTHHHRESFLFLPSHSSIPHSHTYIRPITTTIKTFPPPLIRSPILIPHTHTHTQAQAQDAIQNPSHPRSRSLSPSPPPATPPPPPPHLKPHPVTPPHPAETQSARRLHHAPPRAHNLAEDGTKRAHGTVHG